MDFTLLIQEALKQPKDAILFHLSHALALAFPDRHLLETESWAFNLREFEREGHCQLRISKEIHSQWDWDWDGHHRQVYGSERFAWFQVTWSGKELDAIVISYQGAHSTERRWYVLADSQETNEAFLSAVAEWTTEIRGEVLVFDGGCWSKSKDLFESIQSSSWDNLILEGSLKQDIQEDIAGFFQSKEVYERYRIPWKRGILFLGPPGNGKTHAVKSIVSSIGHPSLYVKSLTAEYGTNHQCIASVFSRARATAPCVLVLEDIDALVTSDNRSFFLNELDGFASNHGIVTIGTTNHPERLDPAILERPSRFDRKYTFGLPGLTERTAYLAMFANKLEAALQLDEDGLQAVSNATDGYSFAYLKELYLSAMMRWIAHPGETSMSALMVEQSEALRAQMTTDPGDDVPATSEDMDDFPDSMTRAYMRRWRR